MNKIPAIIILLLLASPVFSQTRQDYEQTVGKFQKFYNGNKPDSVYALFSPRVQNVMTQDATRGMFKKMNGDLGKIKKHSFMKEDANFSFYEMDYTKGKMIMVLFLNQENKMQSFRVVPFTADTSKLR